MAPRVVTLGETMVLVYPRTTGPMKHAHEFRKSLAGAETNVAIGLSRLGHDVGWYSKLGRDPHGEYLEFFVRGEGIDTSTVAFTDDPTGVMFKERRELGEPAVFYYRHGSAASRMAPEDLPIDYLTDAEYLHLTGITPALSESARKATLVAAERASEAGMTVSFDPNVRRKLWESDDRMRETMLELVRTSDIVLPGIEEGEALFGTDDPEEIATACLDSGAEVGVVKLGAAGAFVADGSTNQRVPGYDVERVVDPVGAGDGFAAGFLAGRIEGAGVLEATERANAVGAFATTVAGDVEGLPTRKELDVFVGEREAVRR